MELRGYMDYRAQPLHRLAEPLRPFSIVVIGAITSLIERPSERQVFNNLNFCREPSLQFAGSLRASALVVARSCAASDGRVASDCAGAASSRRAFPKPGSLGTKKGTI